MDSIAEIEALFQARGIKPTGWSTTADDSKLFEFLTEAPAVKRGLDVYPTGEAVPIIREGEFTDYYECTVGEDNDLICKLMTSGRLTPRP